jgi:hypothetical protein
MGNLKRFGIVLLLVCAVAKAKSMAGEAPALVSLENGTNTALEPAKEGLWETGVGQGFQSSVHTLALESGATQGLAILGSKQAHDLALLSLSYGHMWGRTVALDHWYRGNLEWRAELFGGVQFSPTGEWVIGLAPHLRYNFATGSRVIPFIDAGAGVTATSIGPPDLSNTFEFNLQATLGMHWFIRDNLALTLEGRYLHISCAGISQPNLGLNGVTGMIGLTWFF